MDLQLAHRRAPVTGSSVRNGSVVALASAAEVVRLALDRAGIEPA
jgi:hypothetical protein